MIRREYDVAVEIDEDRPEEVTAVCEESYPGAEMEVIEVRRDCGDCIRDVFAELDRHTINLIAERCNALQAQIEWEAL